jgi:hypothetical protein
MFGCMKVDVKVVKVEYGRAGARYREKAKTW